MTASAFTALALARGGSEYTRDNWLDFAIARTRTPYAKWCFAGEQIGPHVRQLVPTHPATSGTPRGPGYYWSYVHGATDVELAALVETGHALASAPGASNCPTSLFGPIGRAANLLGIDRVPPDLHAGGPAISMPGQEGVAAFRLALWSSHRVAVATGEQEVLAGVLANLDAADRALLPTFRRTERTTDATLRDLARAMQPPAGTSPAIATARAACAVFEALQGGFDAAAVLRANDAVVHVFGALAGDAAAQRSFVVELDDRVMAAELAATMQIKGEGVTPISRVLWRGADDKGMPAFWLVREDREHYGLFRKVGKRWRFTTGDRDEMLANVPDAHLHGAVEMSLARDR